MFNVSELKNSELLNESVSYTVEGKFFYRITEGESKKSNFINCYLADSTDESSFKIFISDDIGESIIDDDETFGMMVGGEYAYFGLNAKVTGTIKSFNDEKVFEIIENLILEKDGDSQTFMF